MRTFALLVALFALLAQAASAAPASGPPIEIPAILSTTGVSAFFGGGEARALGVVESMVNDAGGVKGRPIHFEILDDQTNAEVTVQLLSGLIAKKTAFFLGPTFPGACFAVLPLIDKIGPVGMCLNPAGHPKPGSYQFALYADSFEVDRAFLRYFREKGLTRIALVNANDGSGRDADAGFNWAFSLPENRTLTKVAEEHYNPGDVSVAAQMARVKAANAQAIVSFNTGNPFGTLLHGMHEAGIDVPVATTGGNMTFAMMKQYASFLPADVLFGGTIAWAPGDIGPGPIRDAQLAYVAALKKHGMRPEAPYVTVWDPALLAVDIVRALGPDATAQQVRNYLANLHGWVATQGVFDFKSYPQHGVGVNSVLIMRWDKTKQTFTPASKRGGARRT